MKASEFLLEVTIGQLTIGGIIIIVDDHALDQAVDRMVLPTDIDRVLRKLPTIKDQLAKIEPGQQFWVYDPKLEVGLGCRMLDLPQRKIQFKTVIGSAEGAPYDGVTPVVEVQ